MIRTISILILITAFCGCCFYGCGGSKNPISPGHTSVGAYKYPEDEYKGDTRPLGHNGHDIYTKDPKEIAGYCSICHYTY